MVWSVHVGRLVGDCGAWVCCQRCWRPSWAGRRDVGQLSMDGMLTSHKFTCIRFTLLGSVSLLKDIVPSAVLVTKKDYEYLVLWNDGFRWDRAVPNFDSRSNCVQ